MNNICFLFGFGPVRWNAEEEKFEFCPVRHVYAVTLTVVLLVLDPISIAYLLNYLNVFENFDLLTTVSLLEYFFSYFVLISIMISQNCSPTKGVVYIANHSHHLFSNLDRTRQKKLRRYIGRRILLGLLVAIWSVFMNVFCLNYLTDEPSPLLVVLASCVASSAAITMTLFVVAYNSIMYILAENFQQINSELQRVMNTLRLLVDRNEKVGKFRKLKNFCDISDQIDALAIFHRDIFNFLRHFNSHYGSAMLIFTINVFVAIVSQAFFFYVNIAGVIRTASTTAAAPTAIHEKVTLDLQFTGAIVYALMGGIQLLFVIQATAWVIDIARSTGVELHQVISKYFDERLEKSVSRR